MLRPPTYERQGGQRAPHTAGRPFGGPPRRDSRIAPKAPRPSDATDKPAALRRGNGHSTKSAYGTGSGSPRLATASRSRRPVHRPGRTDRRPRHTGGGTVIGDPDRTNRSVAHSLAVGAPGPVAFPEPSTARRTVPAPRSAAARVAPPHPLRRRGSAPRDPYSPPARSLARAVGARKQAIWLILPVVICSSQRLSHACLSASRTKVEPRKAH